MELNANNSQPEEQADQPKKRAVGRPRRKRVKINKNPPQCTKSRIKWQLFIKEYINNGMNATAAYSLVYKQPKNNVTAVSASRLLMNPHVLQMFCDELARINLNVNEKYVLTRLIERIETSGTQDRDKLRALDLLMALQGYKKPENSVNFNIYSDLQTSTEGILDRLRNGHNSAMEQVGKEIIDVSPCTPESKDE